MHRASLALRFVLLSGSLSLACGSVPPERLYSGEPRAAEDVAVIRAGVRATILTVDGNEVLGKKFEVLPGEHHLDFTILIRGSDVGDEPQLRDQRITLLCSGVFQAQAGHLYRLRKTKVTVGSPERVAWRETRSDMDIGGEIADWSMEDRRSVGRVSCRSGGDRIQ